jgi:hypothetical protein
MNANIMTIAKKQYNYSGAVISHGETIEEVPEFVPKTNWSHFKDFFAKQHRFGRTPFAVMPTSWM